MKPALLLICLCAAASAQDGTNTPAPPILVTNVVKAAWNFRRVDGKLYNVQNSILWKYVHGTCLKVLTNGIVVQTIVLKSREVTDSSDPGTSGGNVPGGGGHSTRLERWEENGPLIVLVNYDGQEPTTSGKIFVKAMKTGTYEYGDDVFQKWDCGLVNTAVVVTTNFPAAKQQTN